MSLAEADRIRLQQCRVMRPPGNVLGSHPFDQRVLIPDETVQWFEPVSDRDGSIHTNLNIGREVCNISVRYLQHRYYNKAARGSAPDVFSCSTLTWAIFAHVGIDLPRYAIDQSYVGTPVVNPQPGDLVFYQNSFPIRDGDRAIGHVALMVGDGLMIHGSWSKGQVALEDLDPNFSHCQRVVPSDCHTLVTLPAKCQSFETALDVLRWLQR